MERKSANRIVVARRLITLAAIMDHANGVRTTASSNSETNIRQRKVSDIRAIPPLFEGEDVTELEEQVEVFQAYAKQKRNWENAFQRWSDKVSQEGDTPLGCCGYGTICDYCKDNSIGRPCVRALNERARAKNIRIDYSDRDFAKWFYL